MKITEIQIHNFKSIKDAIIDCKNYNILVGKNNAGKSNIIDAILFYFDEKKITSESFLRIDPTTTEEELWVECEYLAENESEISDLPLKYNLGNNKYRVRKTATKANFKGDYNGYILDNGKGILDTSTSFFGAKNVSKTKLGEIIYIPALRDIQDETKTQGTATFAKILKEIIGETITEKKEYAQLSEAIRLLSNSLKGSDSGNREKRNYECFAEVESTLREELASWNCDVTIDLEPLDPDKFSQQSAALKLIESDKIPMPPSAKGHGLQRALLVSLIKLWSENERKKKNKGDAKKAFRSSVQILLFEEPEIFLHPPQQKILFKDLKSLINDSNIQMIISSHSPVFLDEADNDLGSIHTVIKIENTKVFNVSSDFLTKIQSEEIQRKFRFQWWLNADRNAAFFSDIVLLVEGNTEKAILQWLISKNYSNYYPLAITVFDCGGKGFIPYFMELFGDLKIKHIVIHDDDENRSTDHIRMNTAIQSAENSSTFEIVQVPNNIEAYLNIPRVDSFKKVGEAMWTLEVNGIDPTKELHLINPIKKFSKTIF